VGACRKEKRSQHEDIEWDLIRTLLLKNFSYLAISFFILRSMLKYTSRSQRREPFYPPGILGYGIERTGVTSRLANTIIRYGSIQIPWHDLRTRHKELSRDKKYILMCKGGLRASIAASILKMNGINNVFNMAGGFTAYQKPGICTLAE